MASGHRYNMISKIASWLTSVDTFSTIAFTILPIGHKIWHLCFDATNASAVTTAVLIQIQRIPIHSSLLTLWLHWIHVYGWSVHYYSRTFYNYKTGKWKEERKRKPNVNRIWFGDCGEKVYEIQDSRFKFTMKLNIYVFDSRLATMWVNAPVIR